MVLKEIITSGKRKTSIARAKISDGKGKITINKIPLENLNLMHKLAIEEPIIIAKKTLKNFNYDIEVKMTGGGHEGQIQAARIAVAKAILSKTKSEQLKKAYLSYDKHMLVADIRRKEAYKPDDSKARAKRQSSKR